MEIQMQTSLEHIVLSAWSNSTSYKGALIFCSYLTLFEAVACNFSENDLFIKALN